MYTYFLLLETHFCSILLVYWMCIQCSTITTNLLLLSDKPQINWLGHSRSYNARTSGTVPMSFTCLFVCLSVCLHFCFKLLCIDFKIPALSLVPPSQFVVFCENSFSRNLKTSNKVSYMKVYIFKKEVSQGIYSDSQIFG